MNMFLRRYLKRVLRDPPEISLPAVVLPDAQDEKDDKDEEEKPEEQPEVKQG
jgi:hypothetical protein